MWTIEVCCSFSKRHPVRQGENMKLVRHRPRRGPQGSTLIIVLIFVGMFSALAVAMATMSGANVQIAGNYKKLDNTLAAADSGQEVIRYWMDGVAFSGKIAPEQQLPTLAGVLQSKLADANVTNVQPVLNGSSTAITVAAVPIDSASAQTFSANMTKSNAYELQVDITGRYAGASRTVRSRYLFGIRPHNIFDYGLGSRGRMHLAGRIDIIATLAVEANAYIMAPSDTIALWMEGKSKIGGTVTLADPTCSALIQGDQCWIGDLHGDAAYANVFYDTNDVKLEFPEMMPEEFYPYAVNPLTAPPPSDSQLSNIIVPANMNLTFTRATLKGVTYIKYPNVIRFEGQTTIIGVIVTDGDPTHDPDPDAPDAVLNFTANVNSYPVTDLPSGGQFDAIRNKIGTFIVAPGFRVVMAGGFGLISGAIGCNGFQLSGGSGGVINGSIINYANNEMYLSGNGDVYFNRSGPYEVPAGFAPETIMLYNPASYTELGI
jgi:hypothetical protein